MEAARASRGYRRGEPRPRSRAENAVNARTPLAVAALQSAQHHTERSPARSYAAFGDVRVTPAPGDESAHTDSREAIGEAPTRAGGGRPPARAASMDVARGSGTDARRARARDARVGRGGDDEQRARHYWTTPMRRTRRSHRLGRPPPESWRRRSANDGHGDGHDFMHSKCPCTHQCVGAVKPCSGLNSTAMLERLRAPLEFTFVRDRPRSSSRRRGCCGQPHVEPRRRQFGNRTARRGRRGRRAPRLHDATVPRVRRSETQDRAAHLFPMASGYSFAGSPGVGRPVVGRVEQIDADWAHLLALLGMGAAKAPPRRNTNRRTAPLPPAAAARPTPSSLRTTAYAPI